MYVGRDYSVSNPGESEVFGLNFENDLQSGDSIVGTPVFTISVDEGIDPDPSSRLNGSPGVVGSTAIQRLSGLLGGVNYLLAARVQTALGNTLILYSHVRCTTPF